MITMCVYIIYTSACMDFRVCVLPRVCKSNLNVQVCYTGGSTAI